MSVVDQLLANAERYAGAYVDPGLPAPPGLRVAVVTCMDARFDPGAILGLKAGDAHVLRNAGGAVTRDIRRSLTVSQRLLGTREIMLILHTRCGMRTFSDAEFRAKLEAETGVAPDWAEEIFTEPDEDVRRFVGLIQADPFIPYTDSIRGFVYDVDTGALTEVPDLTAPTAG